MNLLNVLFAFSLFMTTFPVEQAYPELAYSARLEEYPEYWVLTYTQGAEWAAVEICDNNKLVEVSTSTNGTGLYIIPKSMVDLSGQFSFANVKLTFSLNGITYTALVGLKNHPKN